MVSFKLLISGLAVAGLVATVGCSSSSTTTTDEDAGKTGSGTGKGSSGSGSSGGGGGGGGGGCYDQTGTGEAETCVYFETSVAGYSCSTSGTTYKAGSCPSSGLVGCCVTTTTAGTETETEADCYYSSATASAVMSACAGADEKWTTTAP